MHDALESIMDEQKHQQALSKAKEKTKQDAETAALGQTFIRDADQANAFPKLFPLRNNDMATRGCRASR